MDRIYLGAIVDVAWASWTIPLAPDNEEITSMGWLGIFAGPLFGLWDRWWETISPELVKTGEPYIMIYGGIEGAVGLEL